MEQAHRGEGEQEPKGAEALAAGGAQAAWPDRNAQGSGADRGGERSSPLLANVYHDPGRRTVTLLLDAETAEAVIFAVRILVANSEGRAREARLAGAALPLDSYGAANRHAIASRHERTAKRLRVLEEQYRDVVITPGKGLEI